MTWNRQAHVGGVVAPFAMRLEGLLVDSPQQRPQIAKFHDDYNDGVMTLYTSSRTGFLS